MEEHCYVLPSNIHLLPNSLDTPRTRLPLTDSTGNAQSNTVASAIISSDQKGSKNRPPPNFLLPTLPSQPDRPPHRTLLRARKSHIRSQRIYRGTKTNPIAESEHYQAYRSRQVKGDSEDQIWPDDLEELFLEALCLLPNMGRRKFYLNGKPHGRNELISNWLWLGHCESLRPGQQPDQSRFRTRKQVSSHIQVLKGFMRGHPAFDRLFPPKDTPGNGFEDSFKNDPSLRALAEGRLPHRRSSNHNFVPSMKYESPSPLDILNRKISASPHQQGLNTNQNHDSLRPSLFQMYMTTVRPGADFKNTFKDDAGDGKPSSTVHTYSDSIPEAVSCSPLETFRDWRTRFPILLEMHSRNDLNFDIIHVEVSLDLRYGTIPEHSELSARVHLLMPGELDQQSIWRCTQSLYKPADLYGPIAADPRFENITSTPNIVRYEPDVGTHIRVNFPANSWAHTLQRLSTLEAQFDEAVKTGVPLPTTTTARQYIDQITMFQEIFRSTGPKEPFVRKAVLLWTFKKCKAGERGLATWRYLLPSPERGSCFSPHPGNTHVVSAAMNEIFAAWAQESMPPALQLPPSAAQNPFDPLSSFDGLPMPPLQSMASSADMQFLFPTYGYPSVPAENLSFMSHGTLDSDSTIVDIQNGGGSGGGSGDSAVHMDPYLSAASALASFDQSENLWEAPTGMHSFESDPAFLTNYRTASSNVGGHIWDGRADKGDDNWDVGNDRVKHESWDAGDAEFLPFDTMSQANK